MSGDDWGAWSHHVLLEIRRLSDAQMLLNNTLLDDRIRHAKYKSEIDVKIAKLQVKSGLVGSLFTAIPLTVAFLLYYLKTQM